MDLIFRAKLGRMRAAHTWLLCCLICAPAAADALYRCQAADGSRSYSNQTPPPGVHCERLSVPAGNAAASHRPGAVLFRSGESGALPTASAGRVRQGAVYRFESDGVMHYTNVPPPGSARAKVLFTYIESCYACGHERLDFNTVALNLDAFRAEVSAAARTYGLDEALVRAVIHAESAFDPNAVSDKGAQGLMQLMPDTAIRFGVRDPFVPSDNINGGAAYLAWLLKRFQGDTRLAAAAYNAGEGVVARNGQVPPYAETQRYVERVTLLTQRYRKALADG